jgi:septal ring factor EnvC (AmiA/AmiB activator)
LYSFVFHRVDFIDVPAYPQAGLLEFSAKAVDHAVPLEVLASFYVSQSSKTKEPKKLSEKLEEKIAALEQANKQLEGELKTAQEEAKKANNTTQELTAKLETIAI